MPREVQCNRPHLKQRMPPGIGRVVVGMIMSMLAMVQFAWSQSPPASSPVTPAQPLHIVAIENPIQVAPQIYSGSDPHSEQAFVALANLGIKTIISVDGATPDVATARKHGLRYVHIPIGYGGITPEQQLQLIKTVQEIPGPVFIHCHHGKHRGPAAAAIAWRGTNPSCTADAALDYLKLAGTDPKYEGLYTAVREFQMPSQAVIESLDFHFPEKVEATGVTDAMIQIDHAWDNLKQFRDAQWMLLANHPDLTASHEALQLVEALKEMGRLPEVTEQPPDYRQLLEQSLNAARELEQRLRQPDRGDLALEQLEVTFQLIKSRCADCHQKYRD